MFPNVRLLLAAVVATMVVLSCGFGVFATFRINHQPLAELPIVGAPLQLADHASPAMETLAAAGRFGARLDAPRIAIVDRDDVSALKVNLHDAAETADVAVGDRVAAPTTTVTAQHPDSIHSRAPAVPNPAEASVSPPAASAAAAPAPPQGEPSNDIAATAVVRQNGNAVQPSHVATMTTEPDETSQTALPQTGRPSAASGPPAGMQSAPGDAPTAADERGRAALTLTAVLPQAAAPDRDATNQATATAPANDSAVVPPQTDDATATAVKTQPAPSAQNVETRNDSAPSASDVSTGSIAVATPPPTAAAEAISTPPPNLTAHVPAKDGVAVAASHEKSLHKTARKSASRTEAARVRTAAKPQHKRRPRVIVTIQPPDQSASFLAPHFETAPPSQQLPQPVWRRAAVSAKNATTSAVAGSPAARQANY